MFELESSTTVIPRGCCAVAAARSRYGAVRCCRGRLGANSLSGGRCLMTLGVR